MPCILFLLSYSTFNNLDDSRNRDTDNLISDATSLPDMDASCIRHSMKYNSHRRAHMHCLSWSIVSCSICRCKKLAKSYQNFGSVLQNSSGKYSSFTKLKGSKNFFFEPFDLILIHFTIFKICNLNRNCRTFIA